MRYLFIDFDSFFASVEQQFDPRLRGKPVGVVPSLGVETTCCIAASYEAKAHGVRTGTLVHEARDKCPGIRFVEGNHKRYVKVHDAIKEAVEKCLHIEKVMSIDEMYGRLPPHWRSPEEAIAKAQEIKAAVRKAVGPHITGSIGIGPNRFVAKIASKMRKPDGLMLITEADLPEALYPLKLDDLHGIGRRMLLRLKSRGIRTVEQLCKCPRYKLRQIWGGVVGERFHAALRGADLPELETKRSTLSHSHVLAPEFRSFSGAEAVLHRLLQKACRRLRSMEYYTSHLSVYVRFGHERSGRWHREIRIFPTQDSVTLTQCLQTLWEQRPYDAPNPTKTSVVLSGLIPATSHTPSLFPEENQLRRIQLQLAMDQLNIRYGGRAVYYANSHKAQAAHAAAPMRIAFNHIPDLKLERD